MQSGSHSQRHGDLKQEIKEKDMKRCSLDLSLLKNKMATGHRSSMRSMGRD